MLVLFFGQSAVEYRLTTAALNVTGAVLSAEDLSWCVSGSLGSVLPKSWTDLLPHTAWTKCWNTKCCSCRCCLFRSRAVVLLLLLLLYFSLLMFLLSSPMSSCWGGQRGISLLDRSSRSSAPAGSSLGDRDRVSGGGRLYCRGGRDRGQGTVKGRGCETEFLGLWATETIEVPRWAFMPRLMGPNSAERVNRDPRPLFFSNRLQRCVFALW